VSANSRPSSDLRSRRTVFSSRFENICESALVPRKNKQCSFLRKNWRRRPDLNRGWRFCRPYRVVNRSAWLVFSSLMMSGSTWCLGAIAPKLLRRFRGELQCLARHVGQFHTSPRRAYVYLFPQQYLRRFDCYTSSFCVESTFSITTPQSREVPRGRLQASRGRSLRHQMKEKRQGQLGRRLPPYLLNKAHGLTTDDVGPHFPLPLRSIPFTMTKQALARSRKRISCATPARCTRVPPITMRSSIWNAPAYD
jgi:hypothetical protein